MSGGSKAKTSTSTDQSVSTLDQSSASAQQLTGITGDRNSVSTTDNSGNAGVVIGGGVSRSTINLTATDHGAVGGALDFARDVGSEAFTFGESALLFADSATERASKQTSEALSRTGDAIAKVGELAQTFKDGASNKTLIWISLAVAGVAAVAVVAVSFGGSAK